jgi:cystathionine beta-lyase/cystathionine gamma-synthase
MHSATKYLNGHSDVVAGALVLSRDDLHEKLAFLQNAVGAVPGPLDSFLVLRGLKTLHVRMERHEENARAVAEALRKHEKVQKVTWPGLPDHPQHELARRQMSGFGGMLTFVIKGGLPDASPRQNMTTVSSFPTQRSQSTQRESIADCLFLGGSSPRPLRPLRLKGRDAFVALGGGAFG